MRGIASKRETDHHGAGMLVWVKSSKATARQGQSTPVDKWRIFSRQTCNPPFRSPGHDDVNLGARQESVNTS